MVNANDHVNCHTFDDSFPIKQFHLNTIIHKHFTLTITIFDNVHHHGIFS